MQDTPGKRTAAGATAQKRSCTTWCARRNMFKVVRKAEYVGTKAAYTCHTLNVV